MGKLAEPYSTGAAGNLKRATMVCAGGGAALQLAAELGRGPRRLGAVGSLLSIIGSMTGRWMVYRAGFQSAADPQYTVEPQRELTHAR